MRLPKFIIILPFLCWAPDARAQVSQELSSMPEQWQLTLDVIKSKAHTLGIENDGLQAEHRQLIEQLQKLQKSIYDQHYKNEQLTGYNKERHGRTDQQVRIEELNQIVKIKTQKAKISDEELGNLQWKKTDMDHKIQSLKYTISDIELHRQAEKNMVPAPQNDAEPQADDELTQLRKATRR